MEILFSIRFKRIIDFFIMVFMCSWTIQAQILDTIVLDPDTLPPFYYTDTAFIIVASGFDANDSLLPQEIFNLTSDSTLFDFNINARSAQIYIDPGSATIDQEGYIHVTGISDTTVKNKIYLKVYGPKPKVLKALTRDYSGNGYLDAVELYLNRQIDIPGNFDRSQIVVQENETNGGYFQVDSIKTVREPEDSIAIVYLQESPSVTDSLPQTNLELLLSINNFDIFDTIQNFTCIDGAGPVISQVIKKIDNIYDKSKDRLTITFSEPVITYANPEEIFNVWEVNENNDTILAENVLNEISTIYFTDSSAFFSMTNGKYFSKYFFLSCKTDSIIADSNNNTPVNDNNKIQVSLDPEIDFPLLKVEPTDLYPTYAYYEMEKDSSLRVIDPFSVWSRCMNHGGTWARIDLKYPDTSKAVHCEMIIFDETGNIVWDKISGNLQSHFYHFLDIIDLQDKDLYPIPFYFYWGGITNDGKPAKEGPYYISTSLTNGTNKVTRSRIINVYESNIVILTRQPEEHSPCGASAGLAFIPPIGIKYLSRKKRNKKRK